MIDLFFLALLGLVRAVSCIVSIMLLVTLIAESTALGISLAVALLAFYVSSRIIYSMDSQISDFDIPPDGEEDYHA